MALAETISRQSKHPQEPIHPIPDACRVIARCKMPPGDLSMIQLPDTDSAQGWMLSGCLIVSRGCYPAQICCCGCPGTADTLDIHQASVYDEVKSPSMKRIAADCPSVVV